MMHRCFALGAFSLLFSCSVLQGADSDPDPASESQAVAKDLARQFQLRPRPYPQCM